jgi:hypothetical protein
MCMKEKVDNIVHAKISIGIALKLFFSAIFRKFFTHAVSLLILKVFVAVLCQ